MKNRSDALRQIEDGASDVFVIGGGATGAGCALDAQLRGLRTVLVEAHDFVSATSSKSTKLVHGGVRYLQKAVADRDMGQYHVVKRALRERRLMLDNAPFLAHPLELLLPCFNRREVYYYRIGLKLYDWIAGRGNLFPSRHLSPKESAQRMPMLKIDNLAGSIAYADGQFDDCRYGISLLQTFTQSGGEVLNYALVTGLEKDSGGKLVSAQVVDQVTGHAFSVRAKAFINATGPLSDTIRGMAQPGVEPRLRLAKGIHILLPLDDISITTALLIPKTDDGRVIFAIPWLGRLLVGTTDDEVKQGDPMVATREETEYLLRHVNRYLVRPFSIDQVVSAFAGARPLVSSKDARNTEKLIRDHEVELDKSSGLVSVLGGKWTTYRAMAEDAINIAQQYLGVPVTNSLTAHYPLSGSKGFGPNYWTTLVGQYGIATDTARHLVEKYGTCAVQVLELAQKEPHLGEPLVAGLAPIRAEVVYTVREEMALSIEDVLARRIGLQLFGWKEAIAAAPVVGSLLARELDWSSSNTQNAIEEYVSQIQQLMRTLGLRPENALASGT